MSFVIRHLYVLDMSFKQKGEEMKLKSCETLEVELHDLHEQLSQIKKQQTLTNDKLYEVQKERVALEKKYKTSRSHQEKQVSELKSLHETLQEERSKHQKSKESAKKLTKSLQTLESTNSNLHSDLTSLTSTLQKKTSESKRIHESLQAQIADLSSENTTLSESLQQTKHELLNTKESSDSQLASLHTQLHSAHSTLSDLHSSHTDTEKTLQSAQDAFLSLETELQQKEELIAGFNQRLTLISAKDLDMLNQKNSQIERFVVRVREMEEQEKENVARIGEQSEIITRLTNNAERIVLENQELKNSLVELEEKSESLEDGVKEARGNNVEFKESNARLKRESENLWDRNKVYQERINVLETDFDEKIRENINLTDSVKKLEKNIGEKDKEIMQNKVKSENIGERLENIEKEAEFLDERNMYLEDELKAKSIYIENMEEDFKTKLKQADSEIECLRAKKKNLKKELGNQDALREDQLLQENWILEKEERIRVLETEIGLLKEEASTYQNNLITQIQNNLDLIKRHKSNIQTVIKQVRITYSSI